MENFDDLITRSEVDYTGKDLTSSIIAELQVKASLRPLKKSLVILLALVVFATFAILILNKVPGFLLLIVTSTGAVTHHLAAYLSALGIAMPWLMLIGAGSIVIAFGYLRYIETFTKSARKRSSRPLSGESKMITELKAKATMAATGLGTLGLILTGVGVHAYATTAHQPSKMLRHQLRTGKWWSK
jgi:hypothetical protein